MRYFECLVGTYSTFQRGVIYPEDCVIDKHVAPLSLIVQIHPHRWQERTEADYLAQQDLLDEFDRHVEGGMKAIRNKPTERTEIKRFVEWLSDNYSIEIPDRVMQEYNRQTLGDVSGKED